MKDLIKSLATNPRVTSYDLLQISQLMTQLCFDVKGRVTGNDSLDGQITGMRRSAELLINTPVAGKLEQMIKNNQVVFIGDLVSEIIRENLLGNKALVMIIEGILPESITI